MTNSSLEVPGVTTTTEYYDDSPWKGQVAGTTIVVAIDVVGLWLCWKMWNVRKASPAIQARKPGLILLQAIGTLIYDFPWMIDTITYAQTGGVPCAVWEYLYGLYFPITMWILLLKAGVIFATFNRALIHQEIFEQQKNAALEMKSAGDEEGSSNGELHLPDEVIVKLQRYQMLLQPKFLTALALGEFGVTTFIFLMYWFATGISQVALPFFEFTGICWTSIPYNITWYPLYVYSLGALVLAFLTNIKNDVYKLRQEIMLLAAYWLAFVIGYQIIVATLQSDFNTSQTATIVYWIFFRGLYYSCFVYLPTRTLEDKSDLTRASGNNPSERRDLSQYEHERGMAGMNIENEMEVFIRLNKEFFTILSDRKAYEAFKQFLIQEFSSENLLFWKSVHDFKVVFEKEIANGKDPKKSKKMAVQIIKAYLQTNAPLQVNVSWKILQHYTELNLETLVVKANLFLEPELEILRLMRYNGFSRFKRSSAAQQVLGVLARSFLETEAINALAPKATATSPKAVVANSAQSTGEV